jgi:hypothetical protein
MTNRKSLRALLALGLSAAVLAAPAASADQPRQPAGHKEVTVEYRYKSWESPGENYQSIRRLVKRECVTSGVKPMITRVSEKACVDSMTDKVIAQLGRKQIADLHFAATGRRVSESQLASAR